jgi:hypothetical protein
VELCVRRRRENSRGKGAGTLNAHCVGCVNSLSRQLDVFLSAIQIQIVDRRSWCGIGLPVAFVIKHGDLLVSLSLFLSRLVCLFLSLFLQGEVC